MACFFCVAAGALVATGVAGAAVDAVASALQAVASRGEVRRTDQTASQVRYEMSVPAAAAGAGLPAGTDVPVVVTVYPRHQRVRVQVLTHDVDRRQAEAVQDVVVRALGATVVHRSDVHEHDVVHHAQEALGGASSVAGAVAQPRPQAERWER